MGERVTAAERERYLDALAVVRDRGYSVAIGSADDDTRHANVVDDYLLFELREAQRLPVAHIAAPVFDPEGTVRLALTVVAFHGQLTSEDVPAVARRLVRRHRPRRPHHLGRQQRSRADRRRRGRLRRSPDKGGPMDETRKPRSVFFDVSKD